MGKPSSLVLATSAITVNERGTGSDLAIILEMKNRLIDVTTKHYCSVLADHFRKGFNKKKEIDISVLECQLCVGDVFYTRGKYIQGYCVIGRRVRLDCTSRGWGPHSDVELSGLLHVFSNCSEDEESKNYPRHGRIKGRIVSRGDGELCKITEVRFGELGARNSWEEHMAE